MVDTLQENSLALEDFLSLLGSHTARHEAFTQPDLVASLAHTDYHEEQTKLALALMANLYYPGSPNEANKQRISFALETVAHHFSQLKKAVDNL